MNLHIGKFLDRYIGIPLCGILYIFIHAWEVFIRRSRPVQVERILLIKLWGVGNLTLLLPSIEALRKKYPDAKIHFLTLKPNRDFLLKHPFLDRILTVSISSSPAFFFSTIGALFRTRRSKIDLLLDFEQFCRFSALFSLLSGAKQRIGFHNPRQARGFLYTVQVPYDNHKHTKDSFFEIARAAGAKKARDHWPPNMDYLLKEGKHVRDLFLEEQFPVKDEIVLRSLAHLTQDNKRKEIRCSDILAECRKKEQQLFRNVAARRISSILQQYQIRTRSGHRQYFVREAAVARLKLIEEMYGLKLFDNDSDTPF